MSAEKNEISGQEQCIGALMHTTSPGCPFYGYRWPDHGMELFQVGGNECGLDFEMNNSCTMEDHGLFPEVRVCPVADVARVFLSCGADRIHFHRAGQAE